MNRLTTAATLAALSLAAFGAPASAADLTITFAGTRPDGGPLMVAVHDSPAGFGDGGAAQAVVQALVPAGATGLGLQGLPPGRYAVKAYQDANGDRSLNVDATGRPAEAVAVSGRPTDGWPDFEAAAVTVTESARVSLRFARP